MKETPHPFLPSPPPPQLSLSQNTVFRHVIHTASKTNKHRALFRPLHLHPNPTAERKEERKKERKEKKKVKNSLDFGTIDKDNMFIDIFGIETFPAVNRRLPKSLPSPP